MTAEIDRFLSKTKLMPSGCVEWTGFKNRTGYGDFSRKIDGKWKVCKAHRCAWELANGKDPGDSHVLHSCDNPACVNPMHLSLGTHQDNMRDRQQRKRSPTGENHRNSVLTISQVRLIRETPGSSPHVGRMFGVSKTTVQRIRRGTAWREYA